jgi:uncharacterized membrane protein
MLWQVLFVIGVICNAMAVWGAPSPWFSRVGWLLYVLAAVIWLMAPEAVAFHSGIHR